MKKTTGGLVRLSAPRRYGASKRFAQSGKTLPQGGFTPPEEIQRRGLPGRREPVGVACEAFAETVKAVAAHPREV